MMLLFYFQKLLFMGQRDNSGVKSNCCACSYWSLITSTYIRQLTATCSFILRRCNAVSWPLWPSAGMCTHINENNNKNCLKRKPQVKWKSKEICAYVSFSLDKGEELRKGVPFGTMELQGFTFKASWFSLRVEVKTWGGNPRTLLKFSRDFHFKRCKPQLSTISGWKPNFMTFGHLEKETKFYLLCQLGMGRVRLGLGLRLAGLGLGQVWFRVRIRVGVKVRVGLGFSWQSR